MRPIRECPENFGDSLTTPTATIPKIFMGFCFDRIHPMNVPTKFEARSLPVSEMIGGTNKFAQPLDTPTLPFLQIFNGLLFIMAM